MTTYQELLAARAEQEKIMADLEKRISESRKAERSGAMAQIKQLMAEYEITAADLSTRVGRPPKETAPDNPDAPSRKVAPKYRDPETGDTWSGRGLKPKWLAAALEAGRQIEEFKI